MDWYHDSSMVFSCRLACGSCGIYIIIGVRKQTSRRLKLWPWYQGVSHGVGGVDQWEKLEASELSTYAVCTRRVRRFWISMVSSYASTRLPFKLTLHIPESWLQKCNDIWCCVRHNLQSEHHYHWHLYAQAAFSILVGFREKANISILTILYLDRQWPVNDWWICIQCVGVEYGIIFNCGLVCGSCGGKTEELL